MEEARTIRIPKDLNLKLKEIADIEEVSVNKLIIKALREHYNIPKVKEKK